MNFKIRIIIWNGRSLSDLNLVDDIKIDLRLLILKEILTHRLVFKIWTLIYLLIWPFLIKMTFHIYFCSNRWLFLALTGNLLLKLHVISCEKTTSLLLLKIIIWILLPFLLEAVQEINGAYLLYVILVGNLIFLGDIC